MVTLSHVECKEKDKLLTNRLRLDENEGKWITLTSYIISVNEEELLIQWEIFP